MNREQQIKKQKKKFIKEKERERKRRMAKHWATYKLNLKKKMESLKAAEILNEMIKKQKDEMMKNNQKEKSRENE